MRTILVLDVASPLAAPAVAADQPTLTQDSGAPVGDNQHSKTAGPRAACSGRTVSMRLLLSGALAVVSLAGCARSPTPNDETSQDRYNGSSMPDSASCRNAADLGGDAGIITNIASGAGGSVLANELSDDGSRGVLGYEPPNRC